jgi:hypothetical protein
MTVDPFEDERDEPETEEEDDERPAGPEDWEE